MQCVVDRLPVDNPNPVTHLQIAHRVLLRPWTFHQKLFSLHTHCRLHAAVKVLELFRPYLTLLHLGNLTNWTISFSISRNQAYALSTHTVQWVRPTSSHLGNRRKNANQEHKVSILVPNRFHLLSLPDFITPHA